MAFAKFWVFPQAGDPLPWAGLRVVEAEVGEAEVRIKSFTMADAEPLKISRLRWDRDFPKAPALPGQSLTDALDALMPFRTKPGGFDPACEIPTSKRRRK